MLSLLPSHHSNLLLNRFLEANGLTDALGTRAAGPFSLQVLKKLPIGLEVLMSLKSVGMHVSMVAASKVFDEGE